MDSLVDTSCCPESAHHLKVGAWRTHILRGMGLERFESVVDAGPYITAESGWNAYNIPTLFFTTSMEGGAKVRYRYLCKTVQKIGLRI